MMFRKVLIANRGEIAVRILRTLRRMNVASVAVYSDADRFTPAVLQADQAVRLGPAAAAESYLNIDAVVQACLATGAEAVHPGYGFLSENPAFAEALAAHGIAFIGPRPEHLRAFGLKHTAREIAVASGVPLLPGSALLTHAAHALTEAQRIGYPVMLKSTAGGGGIGMHLCADPEALAQAFTSVQRTATASFGDARVFLERFVDRARHIEVQVFGCGAGRVVALGERDCSLQRRNQKVLEETPAPDLPAATRIALHRAATTLCAAVNYESAGTVEFLYDPARDEAYFLEVNTRLQVEHPVTEAVTGIDLVEWMIRQAAGQSPVPATLPEPQGHAIEVRLYAEMPHAGFKPSAGRLTQVHFPAAARTDTWVDSGTEVTPHYDPMLAKLIVHAPDRPQALTRLRAALAECRLDGIGTNLDYLRAIAATDLAPEALSTTALNRFAFAPDLIEVITPGPQSSLQDLPGRLGLWHVGVPPSGPMDARSFAQANRLAGNADGTAALEMTVSGPTLRVLTDCTLAVAGAEMAAKLDGIPQPHNRPFAARAGQTLAVGAITGPGQRAYLAVTGGFAAPETLGSRSTFALGQFGGHATGTLRAGDLLPLARAPQPHPLAATDPAPLTHDWQVDVLYGPHGAPDFLTDRDMTTLFSTPYEVHYNSSRTGVRLIGPAPEWARPDGGEAGLHPSNLHDTPYAVGAIDFTGDMPILLGPDGPSLGGFVCPAVIARDDLWKIGQMRAGDTVRFHAAHRAHDPVAGPSLHLAGGGSAILGRIDGPTPVVYRRQGDDNLLVEYGPMTLDIGLRLRVHFLKQALQGTKGVIDLTPGIRSLQVHTDGTLPRPRLLDLLREIEATLPPVETADVPSRIVHLPLSWNDPDIQLAMSKYTELVRPDAPWCPSNIDFITRMNGLPDEDATRRIIFDARYFVMGLGDVYLGAPVATPLDPCHRLVTTKYNPARTWTPENAVGIGGAYMCVYGMEGPGGYQLFGRTIQMWNLRGLAPFTPETPWLLRDFDQIRFYPVSHAELTEARAAFPHGAYPLRIEETRFTYADHLAGLAARQPEITAFKTAQQAAFDAERQRWRDRGLDSFTPPPETAAAQPALPPGCTPVPSLVSGNLWKLLAKPGDRVDNGTPLAIIESMKMEFAVQATGPGRVHSITAQPGQTVKSGDTILLLEDL